MPMMQAPYTFQLISLSGHSVEFQAGVPVRVADVPMLVEDCLARGAVIVHGAAPLELPEEPAAPVEKSDNEPSEEQEFEVALEAALTKIIVRNDPSDLKTDLTPKVVRVVAELPSHLRRPTATEVTEAYERLQENINLAE